jgi:transposase
MKDQETQQRFIQLRAQGWTFQRIGSELNVSKGTLINWSRKFQFEIQNHRAIELEALRDQLIASREERARQLGQRLSQVTAELATRDLSTVSTGRLFELEASLRRQILQETGELRFTAPLKEIPDHEYHEHVQDWSP